jgi:hypothetical protein
VKKLPLDERRARLFRVVEEAVRRTRTQNDDGEWRMTQDTRRWVRKRLSSLIVEEKDDTQAVD